MVRVMGMLRALYLHRDPPRRTWNLKSLWIASRRLRTPASIPSPPNENYLGKENDGRLLYL